MYVLWDQGEQKEVDDIEQPRSQEQDEGGGTQSIYQSHTLFLAFSFLRFGYGLFPYNP